MNTTNKYICIHGHFYQPPRENAWLEVVEQQDSALPFHDWNERINFECYAPNTAARILDSNQFIRKIVNNYSRISFNIGPTLMSWMEQADPATYRSIQNSDKISQARFGGHGSALAQVYSHLIMPLANRRDKETQVIWGIRDFEYRFGRKPEGMWLSETAVDTETLEVLAENGIQFTILAPRQAQAVRRIGAEEWMPVNAATVETRQPYLCHLPSGKQIALFFYHGGNSQGVAFDGYLNNGKFFAEQLSRHFDDNDQPQLMHIATDGESYGHHHRHGEMALASCLNEIEESKLATVVNYGQYLEMFPPKFEAQIHENSSWSCVHGVERWRSDCGCNTGGNPEWNQQWRGPLRDSLNWLRDQLIPIFEAEAGKLLRDVWQARNQYVRFLLDRRPSVFEAFCAEHGKKKFSQKDKIRAARLLEMQRQAQLMFTSCGWFFDEVSGIENLQILQYANRAIYYARQVSGVDLTTDFHKKLKKVPSNVYTSALQPYTEKVEPAAVDLERVGMHYATSSLFVKHPSRLEFYNYVAKSEQFERATAGIQRLALGRTTVRSKVTLSKKHFSFAVLYLGQQHMIGNISIDMDAKRFNEMQEKMLKAFRSTELGNVIGMMQDYFGAEKFTIWELFRDQKRNILKQIAEQNMVRVEGVFSDVFYDNYQLMIGMRQSGIPLPEAYTQIVQLVLNKKLRAFFEEDTFQDVRELKQLLAEMKHWGIEIGEKQAFTLIVSERLHRELKSIKELEVTLESLQNFLEILKTIFQLKNLEFDLWRPQNLYFSMLKGYKNSEWVFSNDEWKAVFFQLGHQLKVHV